MPEVIIDGFRFDQWAGGRQLLIVESNRLRECIEYCNAKRIEWLHISPYHGYQLEDVDFLRECPHVTSVHMQRGFSNYRGLYALPHLRWLSVIFPHEIDFSELRSLVDLATDWNPGVDKSLFSASSLNHLWLRGYKPKERNLGNMERFKNLKDLSVILSPVRTAQGLENLPKLTKLGLHYCRVLDDLQPLAGIAETLEELEIDHCKKISDLTVVRVLKHLRKLILSDCGSVPSLEFSRQMPSLEFLSFVGTNVLDGDMTPCFRLRYAGF